MPTVDTGPKFEFSIHHYYDDSPIVQTLQAHIDAGLLPFDTLMRIATIPSEQTDEGGEYRLAWVLMHDIAHNAENPKKMRADSRKLLTSELPTAFVDCNARYNEDAYTQLDTMYYRMGHLARAIRSRREDEGKHTEVTPAMREYTPREYELRHCVGLARPLWRALVARAMPSVLENPGLYFPASYIGSFCNVYHLGKRRVARQALGSTVIRDDVVMELYNEAVQTGMRGVGVKGREDLRILLSDEHPELDGEIEVV